MKLIEYFHELSQEEIDDLISNCDLSKNGLRTKISKEFYSSCPEFKKE